MVDKRRTNAGEKESHIHEFNSVSTIIRIYRLYNRKTGKPIVKPNSLRSHSLFYPRRILKLSPRLVLHLFRRIIQVIQFLKRRAQMRYRPGWFAPKKIDEPLINSTLGLNIICPSKRRDGLRQRGHLNDLFI